MAGGRDDEVLNPSAGAPEPDDVSIFGVVLLLCPGGVVGELHLSADVGKAAAPRANFSERGFERETELIVGAGDDDERVVKPKRALHVDGSNGAAPTRGRVGVDGADRRANAAAVAHRKRGRGHRRVCVGEL